MTWLDGITDSMDGEFEQTPGDSEGQGSLECCSPWSCKESDFDRESERQTLLSVMQKERRRTSRGIIQRECLKGEHQIQDVISISG